MSGEYAEVDRQRAERVTRAIEHRALRIVETEASAALGPVIVGDVVAAERWTPDEVEAYQAEVRRLREERDDG